MRSQLALAQPFPFPALPLFAGRVQAGYPLPADDTMEDCIDLITYLADDPDVTFMLYAPDDAMREAGIRQGALLMVDRRITPTHGHIVVASVGGEVVVRRLCLQGTHRALAAAHPAYEPLDDLTAYEAVVWGVVTRSIQTHGRHAMSTA